MGQNPELAPLRECDEAKRKECNKLSELLEHGCLMSMASDFQTQATK